MIALGLADLGETPPHPCTAARVADLAVIQVSSDLAATGRARLALLSRCHEALAGFVPFPPRASVPGAKAEDWVRRHMGALRPLVTQLAGRAQISIWLEDKTQPESDETGYLRRRAALVRSRTMRQARAQEVLETVCHGLPHQALHWAQPSGALCCDLLIDRSEDALICTALQTKLRVADLAGWVGTVTGPWPPLSFLPRSLQ